MLNFQSLARLRVDISLAPERVDLGDGLYVRNFTHVSQSHGLLGKGALAKSDASLGDLLTGPTSQDPAFFSLYHQPDQDILENQSFRYHLMLDEGVKPRSLIFLVHGFNERNWAKYFPWAAQLVKRNQAAVLMFPLAFHMSRSPKLWNDPRAMKKVSLERRKLYPGLLQSTLSNVAISLRLHANPARFFWSGLVAYHDLINLTQAIRAGRFAELEPDLRIDFFTYSIGSLFGEIVFFANEADLFADSKLIAFCGGPVFNRLSPVTKFILDSEANVRLYSFLVEHLDSHRRLNPELAKSLSDADPVGRHFRCLLNYRVDRLYREERFRFLAKRIFAIALDQDEVVPPYEILGTLKGAQRDIDIPVEIIAPPYPCRHEDPFPATGPHQAMGEVWLDKVFQLAASYLA
ncbi:MAG: DUF6051 family protein [Deltaproteobacteria bacterium]|jgi:hypothetical protein|nr:DUF6051 family protein [Deltaproteobacteria bacterium]